VGVFARAGVADRLVGVLALAVVCCLAERAPVGCFDVAGELDRVEVGLVRPELLFIFLIRIGSRDVGDVGDVGEESSCVGLVVPWVLWIARLVFSFDPARSLCALEWPVISFGACFSGGF
jgi:hypothetical protein